MAGLLQILHSVLPLPARQVLDGGALKVPDVIGDDVVPRLDGELVVLAANLNVIRFHQSTPQIRTTVRLASLQSRLGIVALGQKI